MNRRAFLAAGLSSLAATRALRLAAMKRNGEQIDLIPSHTNGAPNYFCTWSAQNYVYGDRLDKLDVKRLQGDSGAQLARDAMRESNLLGKAAWAKAFHPRVHQDLFFLLDDGWEHGGMASFVLDDAKFPSFHGDTDARLSRLNSAVTALGWRSGAVWCRNPPGGEAGRALLNRSVASAILYWKIDIGDPDFDLVKVRDHAHLPVLLEHVHGEIPVNGDWHQDGRFGKQAWDSPRMRIFRNTDVYRTYDVTSILSLPTTLDRVSEMFLAGHGHPEVQTLLNVEDEVYVAAVLGCTAGIMRHPLRGLRPGPDVDLFFNGPRRAKQRMDEVVRALRWQRIAPPFPVGSSHVAVSDTTQTDSWLFNDEQTWQDNLVGSLVKQTAPAIIARDIDLPIVSSPQGKAGEKPFVYAARFPGGAVAIGAQERTSPERAWYMPAADVTLNIGDAEGPIGIFGHFQSLTLHFASSVSRKRVYAQDLAGDRAEDVTGELAIRNDMVVLSGDWLAHHGLRARTPGDLSAPALLLNLS